MVKVECDGCKSPYQVDEKRIPPAGLRMRCPKCGMSLLVTKGDAGAPQGTPPRPGAPPHQDPHPSREDADLPVAAPDVAFPAVATPRRSPATPPTPPRREPPRPPQPSGPEVFGEIGLPDIPERPSVPDRRNASTQPQRRGFGEIDLMVELPSPADSGEHPRDADDLPVIYGNVVRPHPAPAVLQGRTGGRTVPATPSAFTETDLPTRPQDPQSPQSARGRTLGFGGRDSAVAASPASGRGRTLGFGDVDYAGEGFDDELSEDPSDSPPQPLPERRSNSMSFGFGELELPLEGDIDNLDGIDAMDGLPLPMSSDLPIVASDLPSSLPGVLGMPMVTGAALPTAASAPLPTAVRAGLPMNPQAGYPAPAQAGYPAPAQAGYPTSAASTGYPTSAASTGYPTSAASTGYPAPASGPAAGAGTIVGAELFDEAPPGYDDSRLGAAFQAPGPRPLPPAPPVAPPSVPPAAPVSAPWGAPPSAPRAAPPPVPRAAPPPVRISSIPPEDFGDEIALGEAPTQLRTSSAPAAYDPSDRSGNFTQTSSLGDDGSIELGGAAPSVGDEVDLTGAGTEIGDLTADPGAPVEKASSAAETPARKSKIKRYVVAALAVAAVGGGALALVPDIGAFGVNLISDRLNASAHWNSLGQLRTRVQTALAEDTAAAGSGALGDARRTHDAASRYRPTTAYAGYVAFARSLRFGSRTVDDAFGKEMVTLASSDPDNDLYVLALAAQDAASGQLPRARQAAQALAGRRATDIDVAVLAAEIELAAKDGPKAVATWKRAGEIQKSARTLFGLARAQMLAGDAAAAEASARSALETSPNHVGARTLIASIMSRSQAREQEAVEMLTRVTDDAPVRAAASDAELVDAYTLLGTINLGRSRMSAAEQAFAAALKLDPQAVRALIGNGELFYRSGRFSESLARFEAAMRADADSVPARIGAAKTWLAQERMKEAKDLLKKLRETRPTDPQVAYWLGRTELALGNKKEAEAAYLDAVKSTENIPEVVDAYVALSALLASLGRSEAAAAKLVEATEKFPDLPALHKAKAEVALQNGKYEEARQEFELALSKVEDLGTRFKLGIAYRRLRRFDDAAKIFDRVAAADKDYPGLALERGLLFEETGESERALEMYADALRKAPNDVDLKLRVGSTQVMAGHAVQAEPILRDVLKDRPNSAEANHFLGRALLVRGTAIGEALRFLERAAEIDPNRAEYHLYVGWGANESGQPARAESALKRALELDAELGDAYWQRGVLLQKQGATRDALKDLQTALLKRPSRYEAYGTMALCYQDQGNWGSAEEAWRKAIAASDKVPEWHYRLGKIYSSRNNRAGAATELEAAVTLGEAPDHATPSWIFDAHFLLAEALKGTNKEKAIRHYQRFLETAPNDNAYRRDAVEALESLGAGKSP